MSADDPTDLSAGGVSEPDRQSTDLALREERQRLKWKTGVLVAGASAAVVFYGVALVSVIYLMFFHPLITYEYLILMGLLLAVPTLIALNFFKLVAKSDGFTSEDFDSHPLVRLVREVVEAFSQKKS
ncbi:MAG: hypothetical protein AAFX58_05465 [Pseudomonadota bacterium]